jgi:Skp family chaperone for outer membrane proteins
MKKIIVQCCFFAALVLASNTTIAQTPKVGFFDIDLMVQSMPDYPAVDSLVAIYEQTTLRPEYDLMVREYSRLDSIYRSDSAAKKPATTLNYIKDQRTQIGYSLSFYQETGQSKSDKKRQELADPIYKKVMAAYKKVLAATNYLFIIKPSALELIGSVNAENLFEKVTKELKIPMPESLKVQR